MVWIVEELFSGRGWQPEQRGAVCATRDEAESLRREYVAAAEYDERFEYRVVEREPSAVASARFRVSVLREEADACATSDGRARLYRAIDEAEAELARLIGGAS